MEQAFKPEEVSQADNIDQSISRNMEEETPDVTSAMESPEDDMGEDPFALPSARPKMAASTKVMKKKKKGFFLFRWLFGRK